MNERERLIETIDKTFTDWNQSFDWKSNLGQLKDKIADALLAAGWHVESTKCECGREMKCQRYCSVCNNDE